MVAQEFVMPNRSAALAVPTRARWTQVAPTLLILWIVSTFDKSNISLVIADPSFLKEMNSAANTRCSVGSPAVCISHMELPLPFGAGSSTELARGARQS